MGLSAPSPESVGAPEVTPPVHTGPEPPEPLPAPESLPVGPPPADSGVYDLPPGPELSDAWLGFGFYGAILACALLNATALWALVRAVRAQVCAMNPAQA